MAHVIRNHEFNLIAGTITHVGEQRRAISFSWLLAGGCWVSVRKVSIRFALVIGYRLPWLRPRYGLSRFMFTMFGNVTDRKSKGLQFSGDVTDALSDVSLPSEHASAVGLTNTFFLMR